MRPNLYQWSSARLSYLNVASLFVLVLRRVDFILNQARSVGWPKPSSTPSQLTADLSFPLPVLIKNHKYTEGRVSGLVGTQGREGHSYDGRIMRGCSVVGGRHSGGHRQT